MLLGVQLELSSREATLTHISFFFLQHDYHPNLEDDIQLDVLYSDALTARSPREVGETIVSKLRAGVKIAQASIAAAQKR